MLLRGRPEGCVEGDRLVAGQRHDTLLPGYEPDKSMAFSVMPFTDAQIEHYRAKGYVSGPRVLSDGADRRAEGAHRGHPPRPAWPSPNT